MTESERGGSARGRRALLLGIAFFSGATLMALEILGFRVIDRSFGSALRETSVVIAVFLGAMSVGYWIGGRSADRHPRPFAMAVPLFVASAAIFVIPFFNDPLADAVYDSALPRGLHSFLVTTVLFAIPSAFLAAVYPITVRILTMDRSVAGSVAGLTSAVSTAGSILGSVVTGFWLIDLFQSVNLTIEALALIALILGVFAVMLDAEVVRKLPGRWPAGHLGRAGVVTALVVVSGIWLTFRMVDSPSEGTGDPDFGSRVLLERDSPYHQIIVRESNRTRYLEFGRTRQSEMNLDDPLGQGSAYTDYFHVTMLMGADAKRILFIGLGGGTGPRQFLHDYPEVRVDAVEVDPAVVDVAREYFGVEENERFAIHTEDARAYLKDSSETWDAIVIDAYTTNRYGATIPRHLTTMEFFELCSERLSPDGSLLYHVMASRDARITRAIGKTLRMVFPGQVIFGGTEILATKNPAAVPPVVLAGELQARAREMLPHRPWLEEKLAWIAEEPLQIRGLPVLRDDYAPVELLIRADGGL